MLENNIGYIRLTSFNENSGEQIKKTEDFEKKKTLNSYILDLRNNPGGLLSQAVKISDFLDNGEIVSTKSRRHQKIEDGLLKKVI